MLIRIFRHDLRLLVADKTLTIFAVFFGLLMAYAVANGAAWTHERAERVRLWYADGEESISKVRQETADVEQGKKTAAEAPFAGWVFHVKLPAAKPPAPLSPLSVGQEDLYPFTAMAEFYSKKNELFKNYETDNPTTLLAGRFDPAFVVIYLFPLLIIALTYNLLSREREDGTLLLTLAQPVRLRDIVLGKTGARLLVALTLVIGLTLIGLAVSGVDLAASEVIAGLVLWLSLVIAYTLFWFALAVGVNSRGRSSATNAVVLVSLWLLFVVIVPSLLSIAVTSIYPVPSRFDFIEQVRRNDNDVDRSSKRLVDDYHSDHSQGKFDSSDAQSRFYIIGEEKEKRSLPLVAAYDEQLNRQHRLVDRVHFLSPAVVMQEATNAIAGSDRTRHDSFRRQVEAFLDNWRAFSVPLSFRRVNLASSDYDSLPRFSFREEASRELAARVFNGVVFLIVPTLLIAGFAFWGLRRFPLVG